MFTSSAILGPLLDNQHSQYNVLAYTDPIKFSLLPGGLVDVETTWWTPLLFGVAGVIIGVGLYSLDSYFISENKANNFKINFKNKKDVAADSDGHLSWSWVSLGIAIFVLQYWLSAILESPLLGVNLPGTNLPAEDVILATAALSSFFIFDKTPQGFFIAALTAVSGPVIEIVLIKFLGLYTYAHPVVSDAVPTWIA
jgi:Insulin-induced protein (INSIG)